MTTANDPISATAPGPARGETVEVLGNRVTFLIPAADTGAAFSAVEVATPPGAGAPPHVQSGDEEAFFVLEGRYEFRLGDRVVLQGPGAPILVPRGLAHGFRNPGPGPARMLVLNWPGGPHEGFFKAVGDAAAVAGGRPDFGRRRGGHHASRRAGARMTPAIAQAMSRDRVTRRKRSLKQHVEPCTRVCRVHATNRTAPICPRLRLRCA